MKADNQWVSLNGPGECVTTAGPVLFEFIAGQKHAVTYDPVSFISNQQVFFTLKITKFHCVPLKVDLLFCVFFFEERGYMSRVRHLFVSTYPGATVLSENLTVPLNLTLPTSHP